MRPLPVPLLLLLLSPVPGGRGGCPPCPHGVPEPWAHSEDPKTTPNPGAAPQKATPKRPEPAEEEPEEPCPPCGPEGALPVPGDPRVTPPVPGVPPEPPGDIIPLYCALLAGLVVGLVAYVAFKCWGTCRRKRQLDKARDAAEAEKPRGDGGGSTESAGPERGQPAPAEGPALLPVSPRRREEPGEPPGDATSAV
nr:basic proline-rich protein-like isoform X1 [Taeniopygia guttata]